MKQEAALKLKAEKEDKKRLDEEKKKKELNDAKIAWAKKQKD
jgi:hypothetical protein